MLFLFRGKHGPFVRTVAGLALIVLGLVEGWVILVAVGAVLLVWGFIGLGGALRIRRPESPRGGGLP